jgi:glycosyltransferase involved in cell wall biosynthesis
MARVSIGLPVYNGERYLATALESLVSQTFEDLEIVVCDNASTDATREIAESFARRDPRVRCVVNADNIGAAPNFNKVFGLTSGAYFKWAAHDDVCAPEMIERCVEALDGNPAAVLAHARARVIGEAGEAIEDYDVPLATDSPVASERFASLIIGHKCYEIFGLIRRAALERTPLIGTYAHGDGVLLLQLAMQGPFVEVPERLFHPRTHETQSMSMVGDYWSYAEWFDPAHRNRLTFPFWRIHFEYYKAAMRAPIPAAERRACLGALARRVWARRRLLRGDVLHHVRRVWRRLTGTTTPRTTSAGG